MKQSKLWNVLFGALWIMLLAAEGFVLATIWRLDMLPTQYILALAGLLLVLWLLMGLLLLPNSKKKGGGKVRKGIASVLILLIVIGCAAVVTIVTDVYDRLSNVVEQPVEEGMVRTVYVRADDPAQSLADAKDYVFARVEAYDEEYILQAIEKVETLVGQSIEVQTFAAIRDMVDALYAGEIDAIIMNDVNVDILEDDESYADVSAKIRVLYEVPVTEVEQTVGQPTDDAGQIIQTDPPETIVTMPSIQVAEDITNTPFIVYIAGSDARASKLTTGRNDVNILAVVNPETKMVLLLNTPRDYYIANPAGNNRLDKLTHCGNAGVENSMKALANLYGIRVDYYARINFKGFETMINAIGGITVYSDVSFSTSSGEYRFSKGENYLDGAAALAFARERYNLSGGDNARGQNQMKVITAVLKKLTSGTTILTKYADILDSLNGMFATNISMDEISQLVKMQLGDMASWNIVSYAVTGTGGSAITYSDPGHYLYVTYPDESTVAYAQDLIRRVVEGEILTDADVNG